MRFVRHILGAVFDIDQLLDELAKAVRLVGGFGAAVLMIAKQGELVALDLGVTCAIWLGICWIAWKRAGSRQGDAYGQAVWGKERRGAERGGLRAANDPRKGK